MRSLLLGIVLLLWLLLGYFYYQTDKNCCTGNTNSTGQTKIIDSGEQDKPSTAISDKATSTTGTNKGPILFNYSNSKAILGNEWADYRTNLLKGLNDGERMEITGYYTAAEKAPAGFSNMGEARADAAREALGLSKDRALLRGQLSDKGVDKENPYSATMFKNIGKPKSVDVSIPNKTIIRFPYNSTNKLSDSAVETYLDQVAVRVKKSGEKVRLTGHTDSDGPDDANKVLGQRRADIIKRYLMNKGVSSSKILTSSKGETQPVASNSTKSGKAENRRTELEIIK